jgi:beta-glucosidase/6-phospho-beta-glucosidase/beta-galactosidase
MFQVGVNSWVNINEANTYFEDIWDGSFWSSLSLADKQKLLITSCKWILSSGYSIAMSSASQKVKDAQCELAREVYYSLSEYKKRNTLYASGVRSFNFNGWSETLMRGELPITIQSLLEDSKTGDGGKFFVVSRDY